MTKQQSQVKNITLGTKVQCPMNCSKGYIRGKITTLYRSNRNEGVVLTDTGVQIRVTLDKCFVLNEL